MHGRILYMPVVEVNNLNVMYLGLLLYIQYTHLTDLLLASRFPPPTNFDKESYDEFLSTANNSESDTILLL